MLVCNTTFLWVYLLPIHIQHSAKYGALFSTVTSDAFCEDQSILQTFSEADFNIHSIDSKKIRCSKNRTNNEQTQTRQHWTHQQEAEGRTGGPDLDRDGTSAPLTNFLSLTEFPLLQIHLTLVLIFFHCLGHQKKDLSYLSQPEEAMIKNKIKALNMQEN